MYDHLGSRKIVIAPKVEEKSLEKSRLPTISDTDDIDELMKRGLMNISRMMSVISYAADSGVYTRETVQNLKDLMTMLGDLKKREQDIIDTMTDEQLKKKLDNE